MPKALLYANLYKVTTVLHTVLLINEEKKINDAKESLTDPKSDNEDF